MGPPPDVIVARLSHSHVNWIVQPFACAFLPAPPNKAIIYECGLGVYAEPWLEDRFTAAFRAPAGPGQAGAPAKDVTAVLTGGRLKTKPALSGRGHRLDDVREMFFHAPLGDAEAMRKVSG